MDDRISFVFFYVGFAFSDKTGFFVLKKEYRDREP